jgi:hypothetical protein
MLVALCDLLRADVPADIARCLAGIAVEHLGTSGAAILEMVPTGEIAIAAVCNLPEDRLGRTLPLPSRASSGNTSVASTASPRASSLAS